LFYPAWYSIVNSASELWTWSEFIVLLFNKRKRAIHDFIAGTIVIKKQYSKY
ncbi:RDD family protein, partial [Acinetobacter baumannii]